MIGTEERDTEREREQTWERKEVDDGSRGAAGALEENRMFEYILARDKSTGSFKKQRRATLF